jgi:putative phosphoribosyl transferase
MDGRFRDRAEAGRLLAERLREYAGRADVVVLALPRGGVPVAYEVARALGVPLDVFVVRKLGVPGHEELAFGAIASGGVRVLNDGVVDAVGMGTATLEQVAERELAEVERREQAYRGGAEPVDVRGKVVILVDDGLATGATMRAAVRAVRDHGPERIVVAVPTAAASTCDELAREADEIVCLRTPDPFYAVGLWYDDFSQTTDDEVRDLLLHTGSSREPVDEEIAVSAAGVEVGGTLALPEDPRGIVLFAHGSGSSRHSPRNRRVAADLNRAGFGTLLLDLLTAGEERVDLATREHRFDIGLLASRLVAGTDWLARDARTAPLPLGYFGASTGAAAGLVAAAERVALVRAVVSRGGRPDLAGDALQQVGAPTLLIVGERDSTVLELNRQAMAQMHAETRLEIVPGATHLFEEPGALDEVVRLARDWFTPRLAGGSSDVGVAGAA